LVHSPPEHTILASFHVPLKSFVEADFTPVVMTLSHDHPPPPPPDSPVDDVSHYTQKKTAVLSTLPR